MLSDKLLNEWLLDQPVDKFPGRGKPDYLKQYLALEEYFNTEVHPQVMAAAAAVDSSLLTDHGPDHIRKVIARASSLLAHQDAGTKLSPYEAYLLLVSIHLHDVGNIYGRKEHEARLTEIIKNIGVRIGENAAELRMLRSIAQAHGGEIDGDKDTIGRLPVDEHIGEILVRLPLLAAILRFSDELAEDDTRASRFLDRAGAIPAKNLLYHKYALALYSVNIRKREIELKFHLTIDVAKEKYLKGRKKVYLVDEIFSRTVKMHYERIYCMRYIRPVVNIDSISVKIEIFENDFMHSVESIFFKLEEKGYPSYSEDDVDQWPTLKNWCGKKNKILKRG